MFAEDYQDPADSETRGQQRLVLWPLLGVPLNCVVDFDLLKVVEIRMGDLHKNKSPPKSQSIDLPLHMRHPNFTAKLAKNGSTFFGSCSVLASRNVEIWEDPKACESHGMFDLCFCWSINMGVSMVLHITDHRDQPNRKVRELLHWWWVSAWILPIRLNWEIQLLNLHFYWLNSWRLKHKNTVGFVGQELIQPVVVINHDWVPNQLLICVWDFLGYIQHTMPDESSQIIFELISHPRTVSFDLTATASSTNIASFTTQGYMS